MLARRISNRGQQQKGPFSSSPFLPPRAPKWGEMCGEGKERHRRLHSERSHFLAASALRRRRILKGVQEKARGEGREGGIALSRRGRALGRRGRREREIEAEDGRTEQLRPPLLHSSPPPILYLPAFAGWSPLQVGGSGVEGGGQGQRRGSGRGELHSLSCVTFVAAGRWRRRRRRAAVLFHSPFPPPLSRSSSL